MERAEFNGIPERVKAKVAEVDAEARVIHLAQERGGIINPTQTGIS